MGGSESPSRPLMRLTIEELEEWLEAHKHQAKSLAALQKELCNHRGSPRARRLLGLVEQGLRRCAGADTGYDPGADGSELSAAGAEGAAVRPGTESYEGGVGSDGWFASIWSRYTAQVALQLPESNSEYVIRRASDSAYPIHGQLRYIVQAQRGSVGSDLEEVVSGRDRRAEAAAAERVRLTEFREKIRVRGFMILGGFSLLLLLLSFRNIVFVVPLTILSLLAHGLWLRWTAREFERRFSCQFPGADAQDGRARAVLVEACAEVIAPFLSRCTRATAATADATPLHELWRVTEKGEAQRIVADAELADRLRRLLQGRGLRGLASEAHMQEFLTACALLLDVQAVEERISAGERQGRSMYEAFESAYSGRREMTPFLEDLLNRRGQSFSHPEVLERLQAARQKLDVEALERELKLQTQIDQHGITMDQVARMQDRNFEHLIGMVYGASGWAYEQTRGVGDHGADGVLSKDGIRVVYQAKLYSKPVGNSAVQEVVGAMPIYKASVAWVVTNSRFTPGARAVADANSVRLVDGSEFKIALKHFNEQPKSREVLDRVAQLMQPRADLE